MSKKDLIIVTNKLNDKGSELYYKQIKKQCKDHFGEKINRLVYDIDDQEVLEEILMENKDAKVLLLNPTNLVIPSHMESRNAELNQTSMYVVNEIKYLFHRESTSILVVGGIDGNVSGKVAMELMKAKYCTAVSGSIYDLTSEFTEQFDVIVNAVSQDHKVEIYVDCERLFDVGGNYVNYPKLVPVESMGKTKFAELKPSILNFVSMREIGNNTTFNMLMDVVKED